MPTRKRTCNRRMAIEVSIQSGPQLRTIFWLVVDGLVFAGLELPSSGNVGQVHVIS